MTVLVVACGVAAWELLHYHGSLDKPVVRDGPGCARIGRERSAPSDAVSR